MLCTVYILVCLYIYTQKKKTQKITFNFFFSNFKSYSFVEFVKTVRRLRRFLGWLHGLYYRRSNKQYAPEPRSQNLCVENVEVLEV